MGSIPHRPSGHASEGKALVDSAAGAAIGLPQPATGSLPCATRGELLVFCSLSAFRIEFRCAKVPAALQLLKFREDGGKTEDMTKRFGYIETRTENKERDLRTENESRER